MDTVRNIICDNIINRFVKPTIDYPWSSQDYKYSTREPMCQGMIDSLRPGEAAIVLHEGTESVSYKQLSCTTKELPVTLELYYKTRPSERHWETRKISGKLNSLLGEVLKIVLSDPQCENNALKIDEISNTLDVDGIYDDTIGFEATFLVQYRHAIADPTQKV